MGSSHLVTSVVSLKGSNNLGTLGPKREFESESKNFKRGGVPCKGNGHLRSHASPRGVETP